MYLENKLKDFSKKGNNGFEATKRQWMGLIVKKKQWAMFQKQVDGISIHIGCIARYTLKNVAVFYFLN